MTTLTPQEMIASDQAPASNRIRRLCMVALMSATVLAALDTTIANTALPQIAKELQATNAAIIWVANAYQIAMIAMLLPFASLGESIGYRKVFIGGLALFAAASTICGAASALPLLITGRALQGIGAAAIMSVITALIRHVYPPEDLGRGLGLNALMVAIGFTLGPIIASTILTVASWHWLFLINLPVAAISIALSLKYLPDAAGGRHRFNMVTASFCAAFLGLLTLGFCWIENGDDKLFAILAVASACICLVILLHRQSGHPAPMFPVDLLAIRSIRLSSLTSISAFSTQSLALISLPFFLQEEVGVSLVNTGFLLAAWPLFVAIMAIVAAPLSDRYSSGILCSTGLFVLASGMLALATMPHNTSELFIALRLAVCGIGFGLFQAPNMREIMSKAPATRSGGASGVIAISRLLGQTCGAALVAHCFNWSQIEGPILALWLGVAFALLGCLFSALRLRGNAKPAIVKQVESIVD